tara:strand:- start:15743 stop:16270 length:528 start_codon:yes stop_codon:yes gene_type:complete
MAVNILSGSADLYRAAVTLGDTTLSDPTPAAGVQSLKDGEFLFPLDASAGTTGWRRLAGNDEDAQPADGIPVMVFDQPGDMARQATGKVCVIKEASWTMETDMYQQDSLTPASYAIATELTVRHVNPATTADPNFSRSVLAPAAAGEQIVGTVEAAPATMGSLMVVRINLSGEAV